jgi:hypothetical protein
MKNVEINNSELQVILDQFLTIVLQTDRTTLPYKNEKQFDPAFTAEHACGEDYLFLMQDKKVDGFPEKTYGVDLGQYKPPQKSLRYALKKLDKDLLNWSGSRNNAVKMFYPKGGYMGWHHNANAPGFNILLSWSKGGTGFFRYQDPITKDIVTMPDTPGWTCKVGYYGKWTEPDKIYWHCASAEHEERITLGYVIPHEGLWTSMCEDIQSS